MKMGDIHVIDDNSESTDVLAYYSGDDNVSLDGLVASMW